MCSTGRREEDKAMGGRAFLPESAVKGTLRRSGEYPEKAQSKITVP